MSETSLDSAGPAERRIVALDALRGVAVLGIFMMNIQTFAMVVEAYGDPLSHMDFTGANRWVWIAAHTFFDLKFITIFSVLFGAGVAMTAGRGREGAMARHARRMAILFAIGLIHAGLFWYGDILLSYAVWGMAAVLFLERRNDALIGAGLALVAITALGFWAQYDSWVGTADVFAASSWRPSAGEIAQAEALYRAGWLERVARGAEETAEIQSGSIMVYGPRVLGCMLIGVALYRLGFLTGAWSVRRYAICAAIAVPVGLGAFALTSWAMIAGGFEPRTLRWAAPLDHLASLPAAFGYAALAMLAAKPRALRLLVAPFAAVGRMALSNYIAQTLIATFLFYGPPGLGWFGTVERTGQLTVVLAVWAAQLVWSPLWLGGFRFGPLEWAWRSLTYGRMQPMLKRAATAF